MTGRGLRFLGLKLLAVYQQFTKEGERGERQFQSYKILITSLT
jgi:hypothetical protein